MRELRYCYYGWVDTSVGGLVPEGIIHPVVRGSPWFLMFIYAWYTQFLNMFFFLNLRPISGIGNHSWLWLYCSERLVYGILATFLIHYGFVARVTRRVPLVEQELPTLPEHMNSPPVFSGIRVTRALTLCVMFCRSLFVLFLLAIVLSVLLWFTDSNYSFGIFKLFLAFQYFIGFK
jgi:hypothetical protein